MRKLTLVLGFAAGYVLGAKAGRDRYEEIVRKAREVSGRPAVQDAALKVTDAASKAAESATQTAKATFNDTVEKVTEKAEATAAAASKAADDALGDDKPRDAAPMAGAAASDTV